MCSHHLRTNCVYKTKSNFRETIQIHKINMLKALGLVLKKEPMNRVKEHYIQRRDSDIGKDFALRFRLMLTAFGAIVIGIGAAKELAIGRSAMFGLRL